MYSNSYLLQAYVLNVIFSVISDRSSLPLGTKIIRAAISSIPQQITINTAPFTEMVVNNNSTLRQNPPSIQYKDDFALVTSWENCMNSVKQLPQTIETDLKVGDLIKK